LWALTSQLHRHTQPQTLLKYQLKTARSIKAEVETKGMEGDLELVVEMGEEVTGTVEAVARMDLVLEAGLSWPVVGNATMAALWGTATRSRTCVDILRAIVLWGDM
jgi:hypothetical protein